MSIRFFVRSQAPASVKADALAIGIFAGGNVAPAFKAIDGALGGLLSEMRKTGELRGRDNDVQVLPAPRKLGVKRLIVVGLGEQAAFEPGAVAKLAGLAVRTSSQRKLSKLAVLLPDMKIVSMEEAAENAAAGAVMATFNPAPYRSKSDSNPDAVAQVTFLCESGQNIKDVERAVERGAALGEAANAVREMVNLPSNDMTPTHLAERAKALGKQHGLKVTVLERADMKRLGMGSMLSVAAGAEEPPKVIAIEYRGGDASKPTLGLVGKGVTFDTGGISLKPAQDMDAMKGDMAGGATVIGAMAAIARLKPKVNVVGVVCATDNMPSGRATKPGDIVRAMNGKSIEIINTDAEGRLVLADGLCYARELGATHLVDIATLTGAVVVALGNTTTGVMSNDREFVDLFHEASTPSGERYWELPLFPEYAELIKSPIADMKNSGGRAAGTIYGAMFLKEYVAQAPWIHLDIAGTSWTDRDAGHLVKGPTAVAMRPLVRLAELMAERDLHRKADESAHSRLRPRRAAGNGASTGGPSTDGSPAKTKTRKTAAR
ncbi:MAG: leucyl aminopeptidase [Candidatus Eremiobacter antarcticus]|nr:leucyl aminopeptidase [Candidatus Eremiobacteraeota bacterium]MBC5809057.1 leucyl aminopeptidase [Candidatus Eremiobacteraeota bacterium]PZR64289.1 MAG: leucyl aminopeptidase [Candidatus Eremiobacter sp. RRmetagenome_bin22]